MYSPTPNAIPLSTSERITEMDDRPDCAAQSKATLRLKFGNASGISGESSGQISISRPSDSQRNSLAHPLKGFKKGILQHLLFRVELFIARRTIVDLYHRLIQSYRGKASTTASAGGEKSEETPGSLSFCTRGSHSVGYYILHTYDLRRYSLVFNEEYFVKPVLLCGIIRDVVLFRG